MATLTITVEVTDTEQAVMLNDLLSINDWVQGAVTGKKNNCWKRMQQEWTTKLMNDSSFTDSIPSNQADFVALVTARADYISRTERDAASALGEQPMTKARENSDYTGLQGDLALKSPVASPVFTGNVGVGTSSPTAILDVRRGDASGKIAEFHTSTGYGVEIGSSQAEAYIQAGSSQALKIGTNNTERMRINSAGIVTKPYQPYFAAYMDTGGTWVSTSADVALPFNNTDVNIGGHFNTSNYRFTAPVVGVYAFSAGFITNSTSGLGRMMFWINGVAKYSHIQYGMNGSDATGAGSSMATAFIKLAANDYVDFRSQSGTTVNYQGQHSSFTGYLLG